MTNQFTFFAELLLDIYVSLCIGSNLQSLPLDPYQNKTNSFRLIPLKQMPPLTEMAICDFKKVRLIFVEDCYLATSTFIGLLIHS